MIRLATIELDVPGSNRKGRAFLDTELLRRTTIDELERELAVRFIEPDDEPRMQSIERLLRQGEVVQVAIHPGETVPPEYHAYLRDPSSPETPLFACVLAPRAVVLELLVDPPHVLFETATFQAMPDDGSPSAMLAALATWCRRVWPSIDVPRFDVMPWPVEELESHAAIARGRESKRAPLGAPLILPGGDYPTTEELRTAS
jgi:hypothetical protein